MSRVQFCEGRSGTVPADRIATPRDSHLRLSGHTSRDEEVSECTPEFVHENRNDSESKVWIVHPWEWTGPATLFRHLYVHFQTHPTTRGESSLCNTS